MRVDCLSARGFVQKFLAADKEQIEWLLKPTQTDTTHSPLVPDNKRGKNCVECRESCESALATRIFQRAVHRSFNPRVHTQTLTQELHNAQNLVRKNQENPKGKKASQVLVVLRKVSAKEKACLDSRSAENPHCTAGKVNKIFQSLKDLNWRSSAFLHLNS